MAAKNDPSIIKSGELNRRITIQEPGTAVPDGQGGFAKPWVTVPGCSRVPAGMDYSPAPRKGDETYVAQQVYASAFIIFKIRYRPSININGSYQVVYGNRAFNVRSVSVPKERKTVILLQCEELQAKGSNH